MRTLFLAALLTSSVCCAETYKCTSGGKTVFSDQPCARDAQRVGALQDSVSAKATEDQQRLANERRAKIDQATQANDAKAADARQRQVDAAQRQERMAEATKRSECASARADLDRLRQPLVYQTVRGHDDGRLQNERREQISEAERRVFHACP